MRRLAPLAALLMVLGVLFSVPAQAGPTSAKSTTSSEATFNTPRAFGPHAQQYAILSKIRTAINQVPKKSKRWPNPLITISTYLLDDAATVTDLINACRRGVGVRVVIDQDIASKTARRLATALNGDNVKSKGGGKYTKPKTGKCGRPLKKKGAGKAFASNGKPVLGVDAAQGATLLSARQASKSLDVPSGASKTWGKDGSYLKRCDGACRSGGSGGNMHSKFYLFNRTGSHDKVVMVSSSNLNRGGAQAGWNDLYTMRNRKKSYDYYVQVHRAMTKQIRADGSLLKVVDGPFKTRFFPLRHGGKKNDPTLSDLNAIRCGSAFGRTQVHISMFYWAGSRGDYLADRVLNLARQGCRVSIVYGAPSRKIAERLRNAAKAGLINLYDSRWDFDDDGYNEVRTHAKFVTIKGTFAGKKNAQVVLTGSQNWVNGSLSLGDETTLNISLPSAYRAYLGDWNRIMNHSRRLPYHS